MSASARSKGRKIVVVALAADRASWSEQLPLALAAARVKPGATVLVTANPALAGEPAMRRLAGTALLCDVAGEREGTVCWRGPVAEADFLASCFCTSWMDAKRRALAERALAEHGGLLMIAARSALTAVTLVRELLARVEINVQLHELSPSWAQATSAGRA